MEKTNEILSIQDVQQNGFSKVIRYANENLVCVTKNNMLASMIISFEASGLDNAVDMLLNIYNEDRGMYDKDLFGNSMVINREALIRMFMSAKKYYENIAYKKHQEKFSGKT